MVDRIAEDQSKVKSEKGALSRLAERSSVTKKGLAEKNSHALFANPNGRKKTLYLSEDLEDLTEKEKRKRLCGLDIVMTGFAGLRGSVLLANEKYDILADRYPVLFLDEAKRQERFLWQIPEAAPAGKSDGCSTYSFQTEGIVGMYLLAEGGVFAGLWDMGKLAGIGLKIYCKDIPVRQETIEICNFFDVNPYQMFSEGSCLLLTKSGYRLKKRLLEREIFSEIIGFTTGDNDRVVMNGAERRYLQKSYVDALEAVEAGMDFKKERNKDERTIIKNY